MASTDSRIATQSQWEDLIGKVRSKADASSLATVATTGSYTDLTNKPTIPVVNDATITVAKNGTTIDTFTANAATDKTINITVPVTAADVSALPASTKYGALISMTIDSSTYVVTTVLKDQDGNTLGAAQTIDLPLESVVVSGAYDSQTKEVVLTLKDGSTIRFSVADLVSGLQSEITSQNKLDADLVDDSTSINKFVTASDKTTWNSKQNALTAGSNITISNSTISATDTTYSNFTGATSSVAGSAGLVPAPNTTDVDSFLKGDGTWGVPDGLSSNTVFWGQTASNGVVSGDILLGANLGRENTAKISVEDTRYDAGVSVTEYTVGEQVVRTRLYAKSKSGSTSTGTELILSSSIYDGAELNTFLSMRNNKIVNLSAPTSNSDAATKGYVDTAVASGGASAFTTNEWNALWA